MRALLACCLMLAATCADARFVVRPTEATTKQYVELGRELEKTKLLEEIAKELDAVLVVGPAVGLRYAECGEANAFYDGDAREISMCLELLENLYETLGDDFEEGDELDDAVAGAFLFFFFHELGHALIDVLELPVAGREEDAADQLSAWLLIDDEEGNKAVLDAAISFYTDEDDASEIGDTDFADEHSLDPQRYFNMICWVYGSNPDGYEELVDDWLPKARAEQCEAEYALLDRSWTKLLEDHTRGDGDRTPTGSPTATTEAPRRPQSPTPPLTPQRPKRPAPPADEDDSRSVGRSRPLPPED